MPFVTVAVARLLRVNTEPAAMLDALYASAVDVGAPGRDQIYGYGQLHFSNGGWPDFELAWAPLAGKGPVD
ncbi:MAG: hypothetical protein CM15mP74_36470 [Halieaceae bacterium]|nr:MAG: hypothetical protein CM15mP74_36470 [Halieaceae bacterium]